MQKEIIADNRDFALKCLRCLALRDRAPCCRSLGVILIALNAQGIELYIFIANGVTQKIYISEALPGIVLTETEGLRMELTATGNDDKSAITARPAPPSQNTAK